MTETPPFVDLAGLLDLDPRGGVDMRPTLLRVLTDLYLQKRSHSPEDERYYTELALRLIDAADIGTRATLSARLAAYAAAPHQIVQRLARDEIEVAGPILRHSPRLTAADLAAIAADCGPRHARIIATREVAVAPEGSPAQTGDAAESDQEACALVELFYAADSAERRLILVNLEYAAATTPAAAAALERQEIWRLESAALQHNLEGVMRELERALGISYKQARRIIQDELGEPIVAATKALALPTDVLQRMLLFVNPRVGQSIGRVYELADLYQEITVDAARRLVAIMRDADPAEQRAARYEPPTWRNAAENARRALSEIVRRPAALPVSAVRSGSSPR